MARSKTANSDMASRSAVGVGTIVVEFAQITVEEGARRPPAGRFHFAESRRGSIHRPLFLLVDTDDPAALDEAAGEMRRAYRRGGSLSTANSLVQVIKAGFPAEPEEDEEEEGPGDYLLGAVAVVHREQHFYVARTGGAAAYLFHNGLGESAATHPVDGFEEGRPIELGHHELRGGDFVLMATPGFPAELALQLGSFLRPGPDELPEDIIPQDALEDFHDQFRASFPDFACLALLAVSEDESETDEDEEEDEEDEPPPRPAGRSAGQRPSSGRGPDPGPSGRPGTRLPSRSRQRGQSPDWLSRLRSSGILMWLSIPVAVAIVGLVLFATAGNVFGGCSVPGLLSQAEERERVAEYTPDVTGKRRLLAEAEKDAARATTCAPEDRGARAAHSRIRKALDAVDNVLTPSWAPRLLSSAGARQAILQEDTLYVLDAGAGTLARYRLNGNALAPPQGEPILLRRGDRAGYITAGDLLAMVWMPAGGARDKAALLVLDLNGLLFEFDPTQGLSALLLRNGPTWDKVRALAGYAGGLYLLDTQAREILWYPPTTDGYNGPIYHYLDPQASLDLRTAQDVKVDEDAFVLMGDGQVQKLRLGKPQPFSLRPPDEPLQDPRKLFVDGQSLYVADVAHSRIVEFDREGNYLQQLRYESNENVFAELRDFVVDKARHRLIIVNDRGVYLLEWPGENH